MEAASLELSELGYVLSYRLFERLARTPREILADWLHGALDVLGRATGRTHVRAPLFGSFPEGIPADTRALWWQKVLVHFGQNVDQPCLSCGRLATTHVLDPCHHVVCDHCFDGSSYTACPVCECHVAPGSGFLRPAPDRPWSTRERVRMKVLEPGSDALADARALFVGLCERQQALSPTDKDALLILVRALGSVVHDCLPARIPVRENVAHVFGTLLQAQPGDAVLAVAAGYLKTATDVLRVIAAMSGADPSLAPVARTRVLPNADAAGLRHWRKQKMWPDWTRCQQHVQRFRMAKLTRPLRRTLLALLDSLPAEALFEDLMRHRSLWVWVGEFLHPAEYAKRYPIITRGFELVRQRAPDGTPAPRFTSWAARFEQAAKASDTAALMAVLGERPGELARRLDRVLRLTAGAGAVLDLFGQQRARMASPVLLTLYTGLRDRDRPAPVRVYWPRGAIARGVVDDDRRLPLPRAAIDRAIALITAELLRRAATHGPLEDLLIDRRLAQIIVPFNERTASRSGVALPRGSRIAVPLARTARLFMHWCQPEKGGHTTDLDLSVGFYDAAWRPVGVCSYYQLCFESAGRRLATSGGDLRNAPYPHGSSELVDIELQAARAAGIRYAAMVVNNYAGMAFSELERAFAGLMWRDDVHARHFDPRTVALRFAIEGSNGIFLPLVLDLQEGVLHWLDVQARGGLELNTLASSNRDVGRICPAYITYFGSGVRPSMYDLGLLHAAARARTVHVRDGATVSRFVRRSDELAVAFLDRLRSGRADASAQPLPKHVDLSMQWEGDLVTGETPAYVLFPGQVYGTLAASDLIP